MQRASRLIPARMAVLLAVLLLAGAAACKPAQQPGPTGAAPPSPPGCRAAFLPIIAVAIVAASKRPRDDQGRTAGEDGTAARSGPAHAEAQEVPVPSDRDESEDFFKEGG